MSAIKLTKTRSVDMIPGMEMPEYNEFFPETGNSATLLSLGCIWYDFILPNTLPTWPVGRPWVESEHLDTPVYLPGLNELVERDSIGSRINRDLTERDHPVRRVFGRRILSAALDLVMDEHDGGDGLWIVRSGLFDVEPDWDASLSSPEYTADGFPSPEEILELWRRTPEDLPDANPSLTFQVATYRGLLNESLKVRRDLHRNQLSPADALSFLNRIRRWSGTSATMTDLGHETPLLALTNLKELSDEVLNRPSGAMDLAIELFVDDLRFVSSLLHYLDPHHHAPLVRAIWEKLNGADPETFTEANVEVSPEAAAQTYGMYLVLLAKMKLKLLKQGIRRPSLSGNSEWLLWDIDHLVWALLHWAA